MDINKTMFNNLLKRASVYALAAIFTLTLSAQAPGGRPQGGPPSDPSQRFEFIAGYLELSDSQKVQTKEIFTAMSASTDALRGRMQSKREELQAAITANKSDTDLEQIATQIGTLHGQGLAAQSKSRAKLYSILSAEQKQKLLAFEKMQQDRGGGSR